MWGRWAIRPLKGRTRGAAPSRELSRVRRSSTGAIMVGMALPPLRESGRKETERYVCQSKYLPRPSRTIVARNKPRLRVYLASSPNIVEFFGSPLPCCPRDRQGTDSYPLEKRAV